MSEKSPRSPESQSQELIEHTFLTAGEGSIIDISAGSWRKRSERYGIAQYGSDEKTPTIQGTVLANDGSLPFLHIELIGMITKSGERLLREFTRSGDNRKAFIIDAIEFPNDFSSRGLIVYDQLIPGLALLARTSSESAQYSGKPFLFSGLSKIEVVEQPDLEG